MTDHDDLRAAVARDIARLADSFRPVFEAAAEALGDLGRQINEAGAAPDDTPAMWIDPEPPGMTFRPFTDAEIAALDAEPPRWVTEPPSGCGTCGGAGLVPEAHDGGTHPVHCPEGCDLPPSDHECDTGNFDRTVCPEPCGRMHSYCDTCGERQDDCAHEPPSGGDVTAAELAEVLVEHQRIPMFGHIPNVKRCTGCDHLIAESDGPNSPRHAAHQAAAILARFDVRRRP